MSKEYIKQKLRENLLEVEKQKAEKKSYESDYAEVKNKLENGILKMSQVMDLAGLGDSKNATDRSLFGKKVHRFKDDKGGQYSFSAEELKRVKQILSNPNTITN